MWPQNSIRHAYAEKTGQRSEMTSYKDSTTLHTVVTGLFNFERSSVTYKLYISLITVLCLKLQRNFSLAIGKTDFIYVFLTVILETS